MNRPAPGPFFLAEDDVVDDLRPLVDLRAAHRLVAGALRIWDRVAASAGREPDMVLVRPALADRERDITDVPVASDVARAAEAAEGGGAPWATLVLSRAVPLAQLAPFLAGQGEAALWTGETPIAVRVAPGRLRDLAPREGGAGATPAPWTAPVSSAHMRELAADLPRADDPGDALRYPWDVLTTTYRLLGSDIASLEDRGARRGTIHRSACIENEHDVAILDGAEIEPFAFLDGRQGPILIGPGAIVRSHVRIDGPALVGRGTHVVHGVVHGGTLLGPNCRIGGEVAESLFLGYSNKAHDGYVGNSVVAPWVNLGALTTTSNLKNTYGPVKVSLDGRRIGSGLTKLGAVIGDHVKTAIGTLLGTGAVIGPASNIFGGGQLAAAAVPAFVWGGGPGSREHAPDRAIATARTMMARRGVELLPREEALLGALHERTAASRREFLGRTELHAAGAGRDRIV